MFRPLHLRVRHLLFAVPLAAALLVAPATAASAAGPSADLTCTITFTSDINPPITPEGGPHSATTHGLTGTADCTGTVDGETVTGTGSFAFYSEGTGDCVAGSGSGTFVLQVPTTGGTKTVSGIYADHIKTTGGTVIELTGDITGGSGALSMVGSCTEADPLTQVTFFIDGHVT